MRRGVYPGSFNPPTCAHVAIAAAAIEQRRLDELTMALSRRAFDKEAVAGPGIDRRATVLAASMRHLDCVKVTITDDRLIADIASGFDVVVLGLDKWDQLWDLRYYDSMAHRDQLLASLPEIAVAPRAWTGSEPSTAPPPPADAMLVLDGAFRSVSSTLARTVTPALMTPEAAASGYWCESK